VSDIVLGDENHELENNSEQQEALINQEDGEPYQDQEANEDNLQDENLEEGNSQFFSLNKHFTELNKKAFYIY